MDCGDLHNCGDTTEATTLLQQFYQKKKKNVLPAAYILRRVFITGGTYYVAY